MKNIFKTCCNWKVLLGILGVLLFAFIFVPQIANYAWVLLVLVCPLSMVLMLAAMNHKSHKPEKEFVCPECGLEYREPEWARKCAAWCTEHRSCHLEITKHAIKNTEKRTTL